MKKANRVTRATLAATGIVAGVLVMVPTASVAAPVSSVIEHEVGASAAKFEMQSKSTSNCLASSGDSIQQGACGSGAAVWSRLTAGDYFQLQSQDTGQCLELADASGAGRAVQAECDANKAEQQGKANSVSDGYIQVILRASGKCLAASGGGAVEQQACDTSKAEQQWKVKILSLV